VQGHTLSQRQCCHLVSYALELAGNLAIVSLPMAGAISCMGFPKYRPLE